MACALITSMLGTWQSIKTFLGFGELGLFGLGPGEQDRDLAACVSG